MPSLSSIDGLGDKAADAFVEAAKRRDLSFPKMISVTATVSVSKTVIDLMADLGLSGRICQNPTSFRCLILA